MNTRRRSMWLALAAAITCTWAQAAIDYSANIGLSTNGATAIMGYCPSDDGTYGVDYRNPNSGVTAVLNDGFLTNRADTWMADKDGAANGFYDFAGVTWATPKSNVAGVRLVHRLFVDGGWYDYPGLVGSTDEDTESDNSNIKRLISIHPRIQYTVNGGSSWQDATPVSDDYASVIYGGTGGSVPGPAASVASAYITYEFAPLNNINGIRIFGDGADVNNASGSNQAGFIGVGEFEVYLGQVPEPASISLLLLGVAVLARRAR